MMPAMAGDTYEGPVCYQDGWHWTVVPDGNGDDQPGEKLTLDGDGYRIAELADPSWHDQHHQQFAEIRPD